MCIDNTLLTFSAIHDRFCVNERPDEECYDRVKQGHCQRPFNAVEMNNECRKACGSCPAYGLESIYEPRLCKLNLQLHGDLIRT